MFPDLIEHPAVDRHRPAGPPVRGGEPVRGQALVVMLGAAVFSAAGGPEFLFA
jgi:hypothetical protein